MAAVGPEQVAVSERAYPTYGAERLFGGRSGWFLLFAVAVAVGVGYLGCSTGTEPPLIEEEAEAAHVAYDSLLSGAWGGHSSILGTCCGIVTAELALQMELQAQDSVVTGIGELQWVGEVGLFSVTIDTTYRFPVAGRLSGARFDLDLRFILRGSQFETQYIGLVSADTLHGWLLTREGPFARFPVVKGFSRRSQ